MKHFSEMSEAECQAAAARTEAQEQTWALERLVEGLKEARDELSDCLRYSRQVGDDMARVHMAGAGDPVGKLIDIEMRARQWLIEHRRAL